MHQDSKLSIQSHDTAILHHVHCVDVLFGNFLLNWRFWLYSGAYVYTPLLKVVFNL